MHRIPIVVVCLHYGPKKILLFLFLELFLLCNTRRRPCKFSPDYAFEVCIYPQIKVKDTNKIPLAHVDKT